jgi:hypothetical protein
MVDAVPKQTVLAVVEVSEYVGQVYVIKTYPPAPVPPSLLLPFLCPPAPPPP